MIGRLVKVRGLNRRMIAVDRINILFLEEHEIDGNLVTNLHFTNGKWVTCGLSLDETEALLYASSIEKAVEDDDEKKQLERWKRMAQARAKMQKEVDEALRGVGLSVKPKSYKKEQLPDGSGTLTIFYEPIAESALEKTAP